MAYNNNIIHHGNFSSTLSAPDNFIGGNVNQINKRIIKKCVNINSMFRETQAPSLWPQYKSLYESKWTSSNFTIRLPTVLDNVVSMTLNSIEIPNSQYTFSSDTKTNVFTIIEILDPSEYSQECCRPQLNTGKNITTSDGCCEQREQSGSDQYCAHSSCCHDPDTTAYTDSSKNYPCYTPHIIELMPGNYHSDELIPQLQDSIDAALGPNKIAVNMNPIYGKTYIYSDPSNNVKFELDFRIPDDPSRDIRMNMGWILGYRKPYYHYEKSWVDGCWYGPDYITDDSSGNILGSSQTSSKVVNQNYDSSFDCPESIIVSPSTIYQDYPMYPQGYVSEGFIDTGGARYIFLVVDDFNNNVNDQYMSLVSKNAQIPTSNILARIVIPISKHEVGFEDLSDFVPKKREYFGPVSIDKLHFKLVDEFGRIVNLNNNEISLLLDFEVLYNH